MYALVLTEPPRRIVFVFVNSCILQPFCILLLSTATEFLTVYCPYSNDNAEMAGILENSQ